MNADMHSPLPCPRKELQRPARGQAPQRVRTARAHSVSVAHSKSMGESRARGRGQSAIAILTRASAGNPRATLAHVHATFLVAVG
jgi:hypothetical protein